jgi:hypothetical protein
VSARAELFLGVIAAATLLLAVVQIGAIVAAGLLARRVVRLVDQVEHDIRPLIVHLESVGREASRAAVLANAQIERADRLFADVCARVDQALETVQTTVEAPLREGKALLHAFRAGLEAIRAMRPPGRGAQPRGEDDEALFI